MIKGSRLILSCNISKAVPLEEVHLEFRGSLPEEVMDEQRVPANSSLCRLNDPLSPGESVPALRLSLRPRLGRSMLLAHLC